jgi:hypothetical protein
MSLFKVNAQSSVSGGLKLEANIHQFRLYDLDVISKIKIGTNMGCFLEIELNDRFAIQPEMMFFFRNSGIRQGNRKDDFQQWGMTMPVYLVGREYTDNGTWYFGLGAYAGLGFNACMENAKTALYKEVEGKAVHDPLGLRYQRYEWLRIQQWNTNQCGTAPWTERPVGCLQKRCYRNKQSYHCGHWVSLLNINDEKTFVTTDFYFIISFTVE